MSSAHLPSPDPQPDPSAIQLCGAFMVRIDGRPVHPPGRQGRALLAYLVVNRDRAVSRDELIDVVWPSNPPAAPDAVFSSILARLRQAVGRDAIRGRGELQLAVEAEVDIETAGARTRAAEELLRDREPRAAWDAAEDARRIACRPFMAELDGAWVDAVRAELLELEARSLEVQARAALHAAGLDGLKAARALVERQPYRESGYALLMELQARRGDVAEALGTYERLRSLLHDELGTSPSAPVRALHERLLRDGELPGSARRVPLPPLFAAPGHDRFVGRRRGMQRLRAALETSRAPQRRLAMVEGEAGVGKTRCAGEFAREAHTAGATVLYGRCEEEPIRSYQPFVEALRHYFEHGDWAARPELRRELRELAWLIPEAWPEPGGEPAAETERHRLFDAVTKLLDRAAAERPLLLVLDDLHWADKPTLLMLRHLLRHATPAALLVLGVRRDTEPAPAPLQGLLTDVDRERRLDRVKLEGLDEQEADALIADRLQVSATPAFVRGLRDLTEGNPFFIEESLESLIEAGVIRSGTVASEHALPSIGVPANVVDVILRRLARVPEGFRDALRAAAVIGREFELGPAQKALAQPHEDVLAAMETAMEAGLIVEVPGRLDRFSFSHALVRHALYDRMLASRRARLHLRVGEALEAGAGIEPPSAAELAHHFFVARDLGAAEKALGYSVKAGEEASASAAYEEAADHYARAVAVLEEHGLLDEDRRCELLLALGRAQWQGGEHGARATYLQVAASAERRGAHALLARAALGLGERYWEANMVDPEYRKLLSKALALYEEDDSVRARLTARYAEYLHFSSDQQRGVELCAEALAMARRLGDRPTLLKVLMGRHVVLLHPEHLDERLRLMEEVLSLAQDHPGLLAEAHHWRMCDLLELGDVATARVVQAELVALVDELRQPMLLYLAAGWRGVLALIDGDVGAAERSAAESLEAAKRAHSFDAWSTHLVRLFTPRRWQGRLGELLPDIVDIERRMRIPAWTAGLALARLEVGDRAEGRLAFDRLVGADPPRDWYWLPAMALLAEACRALGDRDAAAGLYAELLPLRHRYVQVSIAVWWGSVERYLGILAGVMGRREQAEEHFRAALERNRGAVLLMAETRCAYGEYLLSCGERAAALGADVERVATPRGLDGLRRRAAALQGRAL